MRKKIVCILFIIIIVGIIGFIIYKINYDGIINNTKNILVEKITYKYPKREVIIILKNGKVYKSKIIDEMTIDGPPKDQFNYAGRIANKDFFQVKNIIEQMKKENKNDEKQLEGCGIKVNLTGEKLSECEYFSRKYVDKLDKIIKKYE